MNRRSLLLSSAALLAPFLSACSRDETKPSAATPDTPPDPQTAYELAATGQGFTVGQMMAANPVYVFFDTQCPHCANLWEAAKPLLGRVKMVWMPVRLLSQASQDNGAAILGAPDPVAAMDRHEALVLAKSAEAMASMGNADKASVEKVQANTELFRRLGAESVPQLYFRHLRSGQYARHAGGLTTEQLQQLIGA